MRAWWSVLLVPQNAPNLRNRYAASLVYFAEPSQYTESGPDCSRICPSLSPISSIACSQLTRFHLPPLSFNGYLSRRSLITSSRTDAPLAQCEPRLNGESQLGSCPIHTLLATSAVTVQPTEQ